MTRAELILSLIQEHPRTYAELSLLTGLTEANLRTTLSDLRRNGYMEPIPTCYVATAKGQKVKKPEIDWRAQRGGFPSTMKMVKKSVRTNPNSVFSLGVMNA